MGDTGPALPGFRVLATGLAWPVGTHRAAPSDFGTAPPDACHHHTQSPCRWQLACQEKLGHRPLKAWGPLSQPESSGGARPCRAMRGAVALTPQGGHTAGAQQGLNKRLLNLFSCCVWRPLALQAVAAPLRPPPAGSSRNLKVRQPECAGVRAGHRSVGGTKPKARLGLGAGGSPTGGCLGFQKVGKVGAPGRQET